jgi:hypothetical protein
MKATHRLSRGWFLLPALAAAAVAIPAATASASTSTICSAAGLPATSIPVGVNGVFHVTVTTCDVAKTPPVPPCWSEVDFPGVIHVRVFACTPGIVIPPLLPLAGASG